MQSSRRIILLNSSQVKLFESQLDLKQSHLNNNEFDHGRVGMLCMYCIGTYCMIYIVVIFEGNVWTDYIGNVHTAGLIKH